jgi:hypothetical protein
VHLVCYGKVLQLNTALVLPQSPRPQINGSKIQLNEKARDLHLMMNVLLERQVEGGHGVFVRHVRTAAYHCC